MQRVFIWLIRGRRVARNDRKDTHTRAAGGAAQIHVTAQAVIRL